MAAYPELTLVDLAGFSGRDVATYVNVAYAGEALTMATLLFRRATCLRTWPDEADDAALARYAVLSLADQLYLDQAYAEVRRGPFQSETIGSYSYSRAAKAASEGLPTGLSWFDQAVADLGVCDGGETLEAGSLQVFSGDAVVAHASDGTRSVLGPAQLDLGPWAGPDPGAGR